MKTLKTKNKSLQICKRLYAAAILMIMFSACKKTQDLLPSPVSETNEEARMSNQISEIGSVTSPKVFFMDRNDVYSITNLGAAKPTVTKKWTIGQEVSKSFNDYSFEPNTLGYDFKTNEIVTVGHKTGDNSANYLFRSSTTKNSVAEIAATGPFSASLLSRQRIRVNPANSRVYYVDAGDIRSMNADGTNNQLVVKGHSEMLVEDVDIDYKKQHFYFIALVSEFDKINKYSLGVCGVDGKNFKILSPNISSGNDGQVRLDLKRSKVYYSVHIESQKKWEIWSISTSGDLKTLKRVLQKKYLQGHGQLTFDIVPSVNKIIWNLHDRIPPTKPVLGFYGDISTLGCLNLETGTSSILYDGLDKDVNCIVAVNS